jgi:hypothetical protein
MAWESTREGLVDGPWESSWNVASISDLIISVRKHEIKQTLELKLRLN